MVQILTNKEIKIINKKLSNKKLSQIERNRLSRSIRPKLKEISKIDSESLLKRLEYIPDSITIENTLIKVIKENVPDVDSIILYGSVVQNNYREYNDIDIMVVTKKKVYETEKEKWKKIREIINILNENNIIADIVMISKENLLSSYKGDPTLIYQLKDHKVIYGKLKIPDRIELDNIDLSLKLDWSYVDDNNNGKEIYSALRNTVLVKLLLNKIIDNQKLKESLNEELGKNLILKLKNNQASLEERKYALNFLKELLKKTEEEVSSKKWEKIKLSNH
ncbi:MAG: nucleotidyltransferase domain-containing protein [Nanoarchaeota archaeon]